MVLRLSQTFHFGHHESERNIDSRLKWYYSSSRTFYECTVCETLLCPAIVNNLQYTYFFSFLSFDKRRWADTYDLFKSNKCNKINFIFYPSGKITLLQHTWCGRKVAASNATNKMTGAQAKWCCSQSAKLWHVIITLLEDKKLIPSATCQANFMSCCDVRLVFGLTSRSL